MDDGDSLTYMNRISTSPQIGSDWRKTNNDMRNDEKRLNLSQLYF
jgi:hypothetical protein